MSRFLAVLALPILALMAHDLVRRPTVRRLALRNVARRKGEAVLVVAGSMLGTAIITASFIVGDTLGSSIRDFARTELGPIDEIARVDDPERFPALQQALGEPIPGVDGTLPALVARASVVKPGPSPRAEPGASLIEMDFDAARRFGDDPPTTGLADAGATPGPGEAVVGEALAEELGVGPGDTVDAFAYRSRRTLRVRAVLPELGLAGFEKPAAFVAPGTVAALVEGSAAPDTAPPDAMVLVSNDGGVYGGTATSPAVRQELERRTRGIAGVEVQTVKRDLLDDADSNAKEFTELFGGIGAFSVIAGILLLVNIFVMLADERKSELGMLRAVGLKRNQLVRAFGLEGGVYGVLACLVGAVAGIGVGRVVVVVAENVFNAGEDERFHITLRFTAEATSLLGGMVIGGVIALLTVWATSLRISRLNVIRAIRDIPEPLLSRPRRRGLVLGAAGMLAGGFLAVTGISGRSWFGALAGPPLAALSAVPLLRRLLPGRLVVSAACIFSLVWGIACFDLLEEVFEGSDIPTFVVQGVILVAAAVTLGAANADAIGRVLTRFAGSGRSLAARLAFAYPMARRFRTSMLLGMYALVIFVLTFLAVFTELFNAQAPRFTEETRAGYDLVVDSNPANPVTAEVLEAQPEVSAAAPLLRAFPEFSFEAHPTPDNWELSAFDERLLARGVPALGDRQARFGRDVDAWRAVLADPQLVVVSDFFLEEGGGPPSARLHPGDPVTIHNPSTGEQRQLTVAAITSSDWLLNGAMVGAPFARQFLGAEAVPTRHYAAVERGVDPEEAASALTGRLVENGVKADSIAELIRGGLSQQEGFLRLMQGYLALGLLVGIAGLGVVMVRAVRERRQQIGMLRAIGFPSRLVRSAFLLEAGFVAVQGIVIGIVLALVTSYQLLANSDTFGEQQLDFNVPWVPLAVLLAAALAASMAATAAPASQASRIRPAVALRIAE
ncbi:MAG TPA: FtsX-like permease family protein [Acidimicrobiales bacterium]|nr:FtsX-like permease family protein [Acidimicrobiales bacterium]